MLKWAPVKVRLRPISKKSESEWSRNNRNERYQSTITEIVEVTEFRKIAISIFEEVIKFWGLHCCLSANQKQTRVFKKKKSWRDPKSANVGKKVVGAYLRQHKVADLRFANLGIRKVEDRNRIRLELCGSMVRILGGEIRLGSYIEQNEFLYGEKKHKGKLSARYSFLKTSP